MRAHRLSCDGDRKGRLGLESLSDQQKPVGNDGRERKSGHPRHLQAPCSNPASLRTNPRNRITAAIIVALVKRSDAAGANN